MSNKHEKSISVEEVARILCSEECIPQVPKISNETERTRRRRPRRNHFHLHRSENARVSSLKIRDQKKKEEEMTLLQHHDESDQFGEDDEDDDSDDYDYDGDYSDEDDNECDDNEADDNDDGDHLTFASSLANTLKSSAMSGTIDVLNIIGGLTASTTGKIISPPLNVTRMVIIPALINILSDFVGKITSERLKDWYRILSTSISHITTVVTKTSSGRKLQKSFTTVSNDVVEILCGDTSRQVIVDSASSFIKIIEVLNTPQSKSLSKQLSILGCRMVDFMSTGKNKQFIHDVNDLFKSGIETIADPTSIIAIAEVIAYLSYALEMENKTAQSYRKHIHSTHRQQRYRHKYDNNVAGKRGVQEETLVASGDEGNTTPDSDSNDMDTTNAKSNESQKRYKRNSLQKQTYHDQKTFFHNPYASIEEVILSSLSMQQEQKERCIFGSQSSVHSISSSMYSEKEKCKLIDDNYSSCSTQSRSAQRKKNSEIACKDVNVEYLKQEIFNITSRKKEIELQEKNSHHSSTLLNDRMIHFDVKSKTKRNASVITSSQRENASAPLLPVVETICSTSDDGDDSDIEDFKNSDRNRNKKKNFALMAEENSREYDKNGPIKYNSTIRNDTIEESNTIGDIKQLMCNDTIHTRGERKKSFSSKIRQEQQKTILDTKKRLDGESPSEHFYRVLDEVLLLSSNNNQLELRQYHSKQLRGNTSIGLRISKTPKFTQLQNKKVIGCNERRRDKESIKRRRNNKYASKSISKDISFEQIILYFVKHRRFRIILLGMVVLSIIWFFLGCFGIFMVIRSSTLTPKLVPTEITTTMPLISSLLMLPSSYLFCSPNPSQNTNAKDNRDDNTFTIRIIRETVHMNNGDDIIENH